MSPLFVNRRRMPIIRFPFPMSSIRLPSVLLPHWGNLSLLSDLAPLTAMTEVSGAEDSATEKGGDDSGDRDSNAENEPPDWVARDNIGERQEQCLTPQAEFLRNRATGVFKESAPNDRATGSKSTGSNKERSSAARDFICSLFAKNENRKPSTEPAPSEGERCSRWVTNYRDITSGIGADGGQVADFVGGTHDFAKNYCEMIEANTKGMDKFSHCMANCESGARGAGGILAARIIGNTREIVDLVKNECRGMSIVENVADSAHDIFVNAVGLGQGVAIQEGSGTRCYDTCKYFDPRVKK
jgi:hypothetical protein